VAAALRRWQAWSCKEGEGPASRKSTKRRGEGQATHPKKTKPQKGAYTAGLRRKEGTGKNRGKNYQVPAHSRKKRSREAGKEGGIIPVGENSHSY